MENRKGLDTTTIIGALTEALAAVRAELGSEKDAA